MFENDRKPTGGERGENWPLTSKLFSSSDNTSVTNWTRLDTEEDRDSKESCTKPCVEIINLTMYLNQKQTSGTEDSNTQLCNISEQRQSGQLQWESTFLSQHVENYTSGQDLFKCGMTRQDRGSTNVLELVNSFVCFLNKCNYFVCVSISH